METRIYSFNDIQDDQSGASNETLNLKTRNCSRNKIEKSSRFQKILQRMMRYHNILRITRLK